MDKAGEEIDAQDAARREPDRDKRDFVVVSGAEATGMSAAEALAQREADVDVECEPPMNIDLDRLPDLSDLE